MAQHPTRASIINTNSDSIPGSSSPTSSFSSSSFSASSSPAAYMRDAPTLTTTTSGAQVATASHRTPPLTELNPNHNNLHQHSLTSTVTTLQTSTPPPENSSPAPSTDIHTNTDTITAPTDTTTDTNITTSTQNQLSATAASLASALVDARFFAIRTRSNSMSSASSDLSSDGSDSSLYSDIDMGLYLNCYPLPQPQSQSQPSQLQTAQSSSSSSSPSSQHTAAMNTTNTSTHSQQQHSLDAPALVADQSQHAVRDQSYNNTVHIANTTSNTNNTTQTNAPLEYLIRHLITKKYTTNTSILQAFAICHRADFLPEAYVCRAYSNYPLRILNMDFTVSSPEVYALALDCLKLAPGMSFLDIGCGCGWMTALAIVLVKKTGKIVGIDIDQRICDFAKQNCDQWVQKTRARLNNEIPPIQIHLANVFLYDLLFRHLDDDQILAKRFDRIHSSASCPTEKLADLVTLLNPGGVLVTPCEDRLLKCTRTSTSDDEPVTFDQETLAAVRYGNLILPTDGERWKALFQRDIQASYNLKHLPLDLLVSNPSISHSTVSPSSPPSRFLSKYASQSSNHQHQQEQQQQQQRNSILNSPDPFFKNKLDSDVEIVLYKATKDENTSHNNSVQDELGQQSDKLVCLPAHKQILTAHSGYFKALFSSGMRDENSTTIFIPKEFSASVFEEALRYMYTNQANITGDNCVELLHLSKFYDLRPKFTRLCELKILDCLDTSNAADILKICHQNACSDLKLPVIKFILNNFTSVKQSEGWHDLDNAILTEIIEESCRLWAFTNQIFQVDHKYE